MNKAENPDKLYAPRLADLLTNIAARLLAGKGGTSLVIECDFTYSIRSASRSITEFKVTPDCGFDDRHTLSEVLTQFAVAIHKESGATGVRILCKFDFDRPDASRPGKGNSRIWTRVTPDARNERIGDGTLRPRGTKLTLDAARAIRNTMRALALERSLS